MNIGFLLISKPKTILIKLKLFSNLLFITIERSLLASLFNTKIKILVLLFTFTNYYFSIKSDFYITNTFLMYFRAENHSIVTVF